MIALFRCGRQSEALAQYEDMRQTLARDLGLQPSPVLERLYRAILAGTPSLDSPSSGGAQHPGATLFDGRRRAGAAVLRPHSPTGGGQDVIAHLSQLPRDCTTSPATARPSGTSSTSSAPAGPARRW